MAHDRVSSQSRAPSWHTTGRRPRAERSGGFTPLGHEDCLLSASADGCTVSDDIRIHFHLAALLLNPPCMQLKERGPQLPLASLPQAVMARQAPHAKPPKVLRDSFSPGLTPTVAVVLIPKGVTFMLNRPGSAPTANALSSKRTDCAFVPDRRLQHGER